jgi:hypothetical protein
MSTTTFKLLQTYYNGHWRLAKKSITQKATQTDAKVLTDYLRVALGHMLLSLLSEGFAFDSDYTLIKTAYKVYLDRGFDRCRLNGMLLGGSITNTH